MTSPQENPKPKTENFFWLGTRSLAESVEALNTSLATAAGELWPNTSEPIYWPARSLKGNGEGNYNGELNSSINTIKVKFVHQHLAGNAVDHFCETFSAAFIKVNLFCLQPSLYFLNLAVFKSIFHVLHTRRFNGSKFIEKWLIPV